MKRLLFAAALLLVSGCDLFEDKTTVVEGRVLNEATGEPIEGIFLGMAVSLGYSFFLYRDSVRTAPDGSYRLVYRGEIQDPQLYIIVNNGYFPDFASKKNKVYESAEASVKKYTKKNQDFVLRIQR